MDVEFDNIRVAFERAMQRNDHAELAMRLVRAMTKYGYHRGHLAELKSWAERAWEQGQNASIFARARGKVALASTYVMSGAKPLGIRYCEEALSLFRKSNDRLGLVECLEVLANNSFDEHVQAYAEEALTLSREIGAVDMESRALRALGVAALQSGDCAKAANYFLQAIQMADWDIDLCLEFLYEADLQQALAWCTGERARFNSTTDPTFASSVMMNYGLMLLMRRNEAEARIVIEQGFRIWEQVGKRQPLDLGLMLQPLPFDYSAPDQNSCIGAFLVLGLAELSLKNFASAQTRWRQASVSARQRGIIWLEAIAELLVTHAKIFAGDHADPLLVEAREHLVRFKQIDEPLGILCGMIQCAGLMCRTCDTDKMRLASQLLGTASSYMPVNQGAGFFGSNYLLIWLRDVDASIVAPALAAARAALGDAEFEAAYAAGQRMTLDEAVALALNG
jgi:tetratricopeptide (TPR) repeat protein